MMGTAAALPVPRQITIVRTDGLTLWFKDSSEIFKQAMYGSQQTKKMRETMATPLAFLSSSCCCSSVDAWL